MIDDICFVIMGFGKKTDFEYGKTINLDNTYNNIIKPAIEDSGLKSIRADEINDSGLIDNTMYALLLKARLVIADISTLNPNAIYELGIRHAVKPYSTIIMMEDGRSNIPFDISHTRIFMYNYAEDNIREEEAERCISELSEKISIIMSEPPADSPMYQLFSEVIPPKIDEKAISSIIKRLSEEQENIFTITKKAKKAMQNHDFSKAHKYWKQASDNKPNEPYYIQQQAFCKYKSEKPTKLLAFQDALMIIDKILDNTNDPETLGITGAIYKNLHFLHDEKNGYLDRAIDMYEKGYSLKKDYYNGENYANCLDIKRQNVEDTEERIYLKVQAKKTRENIINILSHIDSNELEERDDKKWIYATLSNCYYFLDNSSEAKRNEQLFLEQDPLKWEKDTFYETRKYLKE